jgi:hypothetical protein
MSYTDYNFKFLLADLPRALTALTKLRTEGLLAAGKVPMFELGEPRDAQGNQVASDDPALAWYGSPGRAGMSYVDQDTGQTVVVPACGDPGCWYVGIAAEIEKLPFDPADYGLEPCDPPNPDDPSDPGENARVLGVFA